MRTLYFDLGVAEARARSDSLAAEFVVRVSPLLHQAILALFDDHDDRDRTALLLQLAMLELHRAEDSTTFIPLPHEPRCRRAADIVLADPTGDHEIETLAREVGTSARTLSRLFSSRDPTELQELVPARPHCGRHRKTVDRRQRLGQAARLRPRLCQRAGVFPCLPAGDRQDADGICGEGVDCAYYSGIGSTMVVWTPLTFNCGREIANRFVIAPLTTDASHEDGTSPDNELEFVRRRSASGFGATISSAAYVAQDGRSCRASAPPMRDTCPAFAGSRKRCVRQEVLRSSRFYDGGRISKPELIGEGVMRAPSAVASLRPGARTPRAMTSDEVENLIASFAKAASLARQAGFRRRRGSRRQPLRGPSILLAPGQSSR